MEVYARICRQCKETRPEFWYRSLRIKTCAQCEGWKPVEPVPDGATVHGAVVREDVRIPRPKAKRLAEKVTPPPPWRFAYKAPKCRDCGNTFTPSRSTNVRCEMCIEVRAGIYPGGDLRERSERCEACDAKLPKDSHALRKYCSNRCKWKMQDGKRSR